MGKGTSGGLESNPLLLKDGLNANRPGAAEQVGVQGAPEHLQGWKLLLQGKNSLSLTTRRETARSKDSEETEWLPEQANQLPTSSVGVDLQHTLRGGRLAPHCAAL